MQLIAFAGYARVGKSEAESALAILGWKPVSYGRIIKQQLDPLIQEHFGYSAFTEVDEQKRKIRALLELWGDTNYEAIMREFFATLRDKSVNGRLVRPEEAKRWRDLGGRIIKIERPGVAPSSQWEYDNLASLDRGGLIDCTVVNGETRASLADRVTSLAREWYPLVRRHEDLLPG